MAIKILIADDHEIFRNGVRELVNRKPGLEVVAEAGTGPDTLRLARQLMPDILILDLNLPGLEGASICRIITRECPMIKVIVLSMFDDLYSIADALDAGAVAYVLKGSAAAYLPEAIDEVLAGATYFCKKTFAIISKHLEKDGKKISRENIFDLTPREMEVLKLICQGYSNRDIANVLSLSVRTVESYKEILKVKTKTTSTVQLIMAAMKNNLYRQE